MTIATCRECGSICKTHRTLCGYIFCIEKYQLIEELTNIMVNYAISRNRGKRKMAKKIDKIIKNGSMDDLKETYKIILNF